MTNSYEHKQIESKWQDVWTQIGLFQNTFFTEEENQSVTAQNKMYILPQLPYPSGEGLHMGHAEVYTACDIYARYNRMKGKKVMQVIGWDAFGLPAENFAIKTNIHPRINTNRAIDNFRKQIKSLGISVDWAREVGSHNPDYYKFTQWFFLLMYRMGLAYRKKQNINWCEGCKTVLANEQVVDGKCERCGTTVEQRMMEQWFFKITDYADRLYDDLDKVDWPEEAVKRQRDWIGRSKGASIKFELDAPFESRNIEVFTTRPDTIFGATCLVLAPEHPFVKEYVESGIDADLAEKIKSYVLSVKLETELDRQTNKEKTGVDLGIFAVNPANQEKMPVFISDYILMGYGTGSIMAVPAHDDRDFEFVSSMMSGKNGFKEVIKRPVSQSESEFAIYTGHGEIINSDYLNGLNSYEDRDKVLSILQEKINLEPKTTYKLRDWSISRQRFWGAPIPMVYDPEGNVHPVREDDLPVILPDNVDFHPTGKSPLSDSEEFQKDVEQKYGKGWRREVDTLDTFMCSSWYYFRYLDPKNDKEFASKEVLDRWMPVDFYIGGPEHVTGHLLYSRFFTKVLFDAGYIKFDEPFMFHRHQGLILGEDGKKMSKRVGNVINPTQIVEDYGADTSRTYEMFMAPLEADKPWDTNGVRGVKRFITRVYALVNDDTKSRSSESSIELSKILNRTIKKVGMDIESLKYNTAIAKLMEFINLWEKNGNSLSMNDAIKFIKLMAPFAPYVSEDMYQKLNGFDENLINDSSKLKENFRSVHVESWPEYDENLAREDKTNIAVQVNGKVRAILKDVDFDLGQEEVVEMAKPMVEKYINGSNYNVVFVKNRIVSFTI